MKLKHTYEDNMSGKLPNHIFTIFIADHDQERATLKPNIAELEKSLEKVRDIEEDIGHFAALIQKYTSFEKLDCFMLHELIDCITIYETSGMGRCLVIRLSKVSRTGEDFFFPIIVSISQ